MIPQLAKQLSEMGLITDVKEVDFDCVVCSFVVSSNDIARMCSTLVGGTHRGFDYGVSAVNGSKNGWILPRMSKDAWQDLQTARATCLAVTGKRCGYSISAAARNLLKWAGLKSEEDWNAMRLRPRGEIAYHDCQPDTFADCASFDISGCYFQIMSRFESLNMSYSPNGKVIAHPHSPETLARKRVVFEEIAAQKKLRNRLWGTCLGSYETGVKWEGGLQVEAKPFAGPLQVMALLTARIAYELTLTASIETSAVYSNTDAVITPWGKKPKVWDFFGMDYKLQYQGVSDIRFKGSYKVGGYQTKNFELEGFWRNAVPRETLPSRLYSLEWL